MILLKLFTIYDIFCEVATAVQIKDFERGGGGGKSSSQYAEGVMMLMT